MTTYVDKGKYYEMTCKSTLDIFQGFGGSGDQAGRSVSVKGKQTQMCCCLEQLRVKGQAGSGCASRVGV